MPRPRENRSDRSCPDGYLTIRKVAKCLGYTHMAISKWIQVGTIDSSLVCRATTDGGQERVYVAKSWVGAELGRQKADMLAREKLFNSF